MRPFKSTIPIEEARELLKSGARPVDRTEVVPVTLAAGRVAAADFASTIFVPPFSRSAMDGYAVVADDTRGASRERPVRLRIVERVFTGNTPTHLVVPGTCAEIATGAPLPDGADAVVMVEETGRVDEEHVAIGPKRSRSRTSAGREPTSRPAISSCNEATCSIRAGSVPLRQLDMRRSRCSRSRWSPSSRPVTK
ncbi:MAG: hypothetical protein QM736_23415 [Vicinamibacterales bacterium]